LGAETACRHSFHSHRITITTKLRAAGNDWPTIQALVRWRSVESAMTYARLTPENHAEILAEALATDATAITTRHLPTIDAAEFAASISSAAAAAAAPDDEDN